MNKAIQFLGMIKKAGKLVSGQFAVENAVKSYKAKLVIVAEDASENTRKEFRDMCSFYETDYLECASKEEIGHVIGCEYRACVAILDEGFANALKKKLTDTI